MRKILFTAILIFTLALSVTAEAKEIRVGLSDSGNIVKNTNVIVGFGINETFYECHSFYSESGFRVEKGNYSQTDTKVFSSYEEAELACVPGEVPMLRSKGNWVRSAVGTDSVLCVYSGNSIIFTYKNDYPLRFKTYENISQLSSGNYRGSIEFDTNLKAVNVVDMNEYLYGVIGAEMPSSWHIEALKAQAVAGRSYAYFSSDKHKDDGYDLCDTVHCQVYGGMASESETVTNAVNQTKDEYVFCDGEVINAVFHSSSGGYTSSAESVWLNPVKYLVAVEDSYDTEGKSWSHTYSLNSLSDETTGQVTQVVLKINAKTKRVEEMTLKGEKQNKVITEGKIRSLLSDLESTLFSFSQPLSSSKSVIYGITADGIYPLENMTVISAEKTGSIGSDIYTISADGTKKLSNDETDGYIYVSSSGENIILYGKGWGHGVGMSQFGAKGMAENGFDYKQILTHYYTGTEVKKADF